MARRILFALEQSMEEAQDVVVSFDIGLKNLGIAAVALCDDDAARLLVWRVVSLVEAGRKGVPRPEVLVERLFGRLDELFEELRPHRLTVLIENQPSKGVMKTLQTWIHSYFLLRKRWQGAAEAVHLVSATQKLRGHDHAPAEPVLPPAGAPRSARYTYNKKMGIALARRYIQGDAALEALFGEQAKGDDLADALLQALAWLRGVRQVAIQRVCAATPCAARPCSASTPAPAAAAPRCACTPGCGCAG